MAAIQERNQDATVYCGNVDDKVTEALLWELFLQAGPVVNVHMPKDRITQNHQGYGFIEFMSEEDADYAIKIMNMIKVYGKPVRVNKASAHNKNLDVGANIFIGNLDPDIDEKLLYDTFSAFGVILQTPKIMRDPETGNSKGFAFINFASFEASDAAIDAMNGQYLSNRPISVSYSFKKDAKGERHGSAAERLLAANNPLTQTDRPHQLFADAPPSIPMNIPMDPMGGPPMGGPPPVLPPPIIPPPMGVAPPNMMGMNPNMLPPTSSINESHRNLPPPVPPPMGNMGNMGNMRPPPNMGMPPNMSNMSDQQKMGPPMNFPPGMPPNFMNAPPPLPGMPSFHNMRFPTNVPPPGFPSGPPPSSHGDNQPPPPMSMSNSSHSDSDSIQSNNQLPPPIPPPMSQNDGPILPPPGHGGSMGHMDHGPPQPPFGMGMGFGNRPPGWGPRGMMGPPGGPMGPPRGMMHHRMGFDPNMRDMPPRPPPMPNMSRPPPPSSM